MHKNGLHCHKTFTFISVVLQPEIVAFKVNRKDLLIIPYLSTDF